MHAMRKRLFFLVLVSVLIVHHSFAQDATTTAPVVNASPSATSSSLKMGLGIQSGVRFHDPKDFNSFTSDLWNSFLTEYTNNPSYKKSIYPGVFLTLNGTFDIHSRFQVAPFLQGMWAGKQFIFSGEVEGDLHVNTYTAMGGVNLWVRALDFERYTIRAGFGGYGAYTIARMTGDIPLTILSGSGWGIRGLVGSEMRLNDRFTLTLDCAVPWGVSQLDKQTIDKLKKENSSITAPDEFAHFGFEIHPGVMFYF